MARPSSHSGEQPQQPQAQQATSTAAPAARSNNNEQDKDGVTFSDLEYGVKSFYAILKPGASPLPLLVYSKFR
jgi:hypothetical protein